MSAESKLEPCPFCGAVPRKFNCVESDGFVSGTFVRCDECGIDMNDEYEAGAVEAWNRRAARPSAPVGEVAPVARLPPIEVDPDMPSREYIPLPGGWEVQTKGSGSSYRLLDRKTGERHLILCNDGRLVHDFLTRMAKEVHAACAAEAWNPTHRHVKRGSTYRVVGEARVQVAHDFRSLREDDRLTVYQGEDGQLWARFTDEFNDGRFVAIDRSGAEG